MTSFDWPARADPLLGRAEHVDLHSTFIASINYNYNSRDKETEAERMFNKLFKIILHFTSIAILYTKLKVP